MNELLKEIYKSLKNINLTRSGNHFSTEWLGRSSRHYSWVLATDHLPALDMMLGLYVRLNKQADKLKVDGDNKNIELLDDITKRLWADLIDESVRKRPHTLRVKSDHSHSIE